MKKTNEIPHADLVERFLPSVPQFGLRKPVPIDAALDGNVLTVVFEDGRKLDFDTNTKPVALPTEEEQMIAKAEAEIEAAHVAIDTAKKAKKELKKAEPETKGKGLS